MIYSKKLQSPLVQRKAGFSKELFGGDPNGFLHGLAYDEGKSWQINRKRIGKQLHLGILESYIEVSLVIEDRHVLGYYTVIWAITRGVHFWCRKVFEGVQIHVLNLIRKHSFGAEF